MKRFLIGLAALAALAGAAHGEDWTDKLSPRMRREIKPMLNENWSPRREVELTPQEKRDWQFLVPTVENQLKAVPPVAPIPTAKEKK